MVTTDLSEYFKWYYYSAHHPSWDTAVVVRDFQAGKSLTDVYKDLGLPKKSVKPKP